MDLVQWGKARYFLNTMYNRRWFPLIMFTFFLEVQVSKEYLMKDLKGIIIPIPLSDDITFDRENIK